MVTMVQSAADLPPIKMTRFGRHPFRWSPLILPLVPTGPMAQPSLESESQPFQ